MSARFVARAVAFLGASIFSAIVTNYFPDTPSGDALKAAVLWVALNPFFRLLWGSELVEWRYWAGGALAVPTVGILGHLGRDVPSIFKEAFTVVIIATSIIMMIVTRKGRRARKENA